MKHNGYRELICKLKVDFIYSSVFIYNYKKAIVILLFL